MAKKETPAQIAAKLMARKRQNFEAVGLQGDMAALPQQAAIEVTREGEKRGGRVVDNDSARRIDGIESIRPLLKKQECAGCYDALRRLERDQLTRMGEGDKGRFLERVDGQGALDLADKIIEAAQDIEGVERRLSRRDWWLINELIRPSRAHDGWRGVVFYVTGEHNEHAQAGAFRAAAINLRDAYEDLEQERAGQKRKAA